MRGKLVVGNWKMNGGLAANKTLLAEIKSGWAAQRGRNIAVCAPYPYLAQVSAALDATPIAWGAQDVSEHDSGAFTGEVSARMLAEFGCRYAIVGHSERRQHYGDTDAVVAAKAVATLAVGLTPIACVGETLAERDAGATMAVVSRQLEAVLGAVGENAVKIVVAYEPVWAIGTGKIPTTSEIEEMHAAIRGALVERYGERGQGMRILYGGSVKGTNAPEIFAIADVDGALVGGASLKEADFLPIVAAAASASVE